MKAIKYLVIFALWVNGMSSITISEDCAAPKRAYETIVLFDDKPICYPMFRSSHFSFFGFGSLLATKLQKY